MNRFHQKRVGPVLAILVMQMGFLPGAAMLMASGLTWLAIHECAKVPGSLRNASASKTLTLALSSQPLSAADYKAVAAQLAEFVPNLTVDGSKSSLVVAAAEPDGHQEWIYAVTTVQTLMPGVRWKARKLCMADCGQGARQAFMVDLVGERVSVSTGGA